jgi:hypothetical protein
MESGICWRSSITSPVSDSFPLQTPNGVLICKLIRELCKEFINEESPKCCLMNYRIYEEDIYRLINEDPTLENKYKFSYIDNLINFGRIDEEFDAVFPVQLYNLSQPFNVYNKDFGNHARIADKWGSFFTYRDSIEPCL